MTESDYQYRTPAPDRPGTGQHASSGTMDALGSAASDTAGTAKEQTRQVAGEVKAQARSLATDARNRMGAEVQSQNDRLAESLRHFAGELDDMVADRDDSPARSVVLQVSQGGRRVAEYLVEHGPDGVLREGRDRCGRPWPGRRRHGHRRHAAQHHQRPTAVGTTRTFRPLNLRPEHHALPAAEA